jgi:hypothetical protein
MQEPIGTDREISARHKLVHDLRKDIRVVICKTQGHGRFRKEHE